MQISLFKSKLKRRGQKVLETKQLGKFAPTDIILGFIKTEKTDNQLRIVSKIKVPVLDKDGNKVKEKYTVTFKSGRTVEKEKVKTEVKEKETLKITFKVLKWANKVDIKKAVESLYGVKVEKVNIVKVPYKKRQRRGLVRKSFVKAIVTLKQGEKLPDLTKVA